MKVMGQNQFTGAVQERKTPGSPTREKAFLQGVRADAFISSEKPANRLHFAGNKNPKSGQPAKKSFWKGPIPKIVGGGLLLATGVGIKIVGAATVVAAPVLIPVGLGVGVLGSCILGWGAWQALKKDQASQESAPDETEAKTEAPPHSAPGDVSDVDDEALEPETHAIHDAADAQTRTRTNTPVPPEGDAGFQAAGLGAAGAAGNQTFQTFFNPEAVSASVDQFIEKLNTNPEETLNELLKTVPPELKTLLGGVQQFMGQFVNQFAPPPSTQSDKRD